MRTVTWLRTRIVSVLLALVLFVVSGGSLLDSGMHTNAYLSQFYDAYDALTGNFLRSYELTGDFNVSDPASILPGVIGNDDRHQRDPKCGVVKLLTSTGYGTGFIVDERTIATAAHCVFTYGSAKPKKINDIIFFDSNGNETNKEVTPIEYHVPQEFIRNNRGYYENGTPKYSAISDYALITVKESLCDYECFDLSVLLGSFVEDNRQNSLGQVKITGFPSLILQNGQRVNVNSYTNHNMYTGEGSVNKIDDVDIEHGIDFTPGNSGGPIYVEQTIGGYHCNSVIGIAIAYNEGGYNVAKRMTPSMITFFIGNDNRYYERSPFV